MGMMLGRVAFEDEAPPVSTICSRVTETCGLLVAVDESGEDAYGESHTTIAFACAPAVTIDVYTCRSAAAGTEPAGGQTVCLQGFIGQERTLMVATALALESLGGVPHGGIAEDDRRDFGKRISQSDLESRRREAERQTRKSTRTRLLMLPVIIPLGIVFIVWNFVTAPFEIWSQLRRLRKAQRARDGNK